METKVGINGCFTHDGSHQQYVLIVLEMGHELGTNDYQCMALTIKLAGAILNGSPNSNITEKFVFT